MSKLLIVLTLIMSLQARADTDSAAHFGMSYAASTFMWGITRKGFGMDNKNAMLFTAFTVLAAGLTKEALDAIERGDEHLDARDMLYNTLGVGASIGTCLIFDF